MQDRSEFRFSLPDDEYLWLLGVAQCAFSSNCGLIIEGILKAEPDESWSALVDLPAGQLKPVITKSITNVAGDEISSRFSNLVQKRNRIMHGFRVTSEGGKQILATKDRTTQEQSHITKDFLREFINSCEDLGDLLEQFRQQR